MGNLCCKPSTRRRNPEADSDSSQRQCRNVVLQSLEPIPPTEPEVVSNHKHSNENNGEQEHLYTDFSAQLEESSDVVQHTITSCLCNTLNNQNLNKSEGPSLKEKLQPGQGDNRFGKIQKNLNCLLGNGRNQVLTIPEIVEELMPRNYPEWVDFDGTGKLVTFVPDWFLTKAPKYVDPSRGPQLQE